MLQREEHETLRWRISFIGYVIVAALLVLAFGFWNMQIVQVSYYQQRADQNRVREIPLLAPRGRIYDREHRVLADNRPSYNIILIRENSPHTVEQTAAMLSSGISMSKDEVLESINRSIRRHVPKFRPIVLKEDVSVDDIAYVKSHRYELPEIAVELQPRRRYFEGQLAAHAMGYVGEVTEAELTTPEFVNFKSGDQVGKTGLERQYNNLLVGQDGFKRVIVNSFGREMGQLEEQPYVAGNDLVTTIDLDLQRAAEDMVGERSGAVVALDPRTGEILAMVSRPAYDPNLFATRISPVDWNNLITDPRKPMQNRAIQSRFSPGSVFKVFMAAAGLEAGTLNPLRSVYCPGYASFYGHTFACDKHEGHGTLGLHDAIVTSCNVFFYNVGNDLGISRIYQYATMMGLGRKSGIDLPNEDSGLIPSEAWKQRVYKAKWYAGETISVAIGQGYVSITPLQAAWAMGGLTTGGRLKQPHFVKPEQLKKLSLPANEIVEEDYPIHQSTVNIVTTAMWGVVNEEGGTGFRARIEGFDVAGKTGTAQVVGKQANLKGQAYKDNSWFVGFAPSRNPEIVVAAFIENGGWGAEAAAPVAHAVLETYYKKKLGQFDGKVTTIAAN
ncbi:MAG TPA: penicillin-binding protein 2 [Terriglobia bacterium]|nr:penicillin-binding protein 2 [Terriglobia bacterium]